MKRLLDLLNAHSGEFNVSVIVPVEHESFDKEVNRNRVKVAIKEAGEKILTQRSDYDFLVGKAAALFDQIDWEHPAKGVGLFFSPSVSEWTYFTQPVTEKIIAGELFETRDIVYEITNTMRFWLLVISMNRTRLFWGEGNKIHEMQDERFPLHYVEEFDFDQTPSRIRSTQGVEKSRVQIERSMEYIRKVDALLDFYLRMQNVPVILGGVSEVTSMLEEITKHSGAMAGKVEGNFDYATDAEIRDKAMQQIALWKGSQTAKLIHQFEEAVGAHRCVWGVEEVWKAAVEGRCDTLLVEKDYLQPAMFTNDLFLINPNGPVENLSPRTADVVNNIISMVMEKNGKIVFAENEQLASFNKIASLLRY